MHNKHACLIVTPIYLSLILASSLSTLQQATGKLAENGSIAITGLKNNTIITVKNSDSDNATLIIGTLTAAGGMATILIGFRQWLSQQQDNSVSRNPQSVKDIVLPLIKEFDESQGMLYAKQILDDETPKGGEHWKYQLDYYSRRRLPIILRTDTPIGEIAIRKSFDELINFFGKLEYFYSAGLLTTQQLDYFLVYINKASNEKAVVNYVRTNTFTSTLHGRLDRRLESKAMTF